MLTDDHAAVNLRTRMDHHRAAVFEVPECEGDSLALLHGNQHAGVAAGDLALMGRVFVEDAVHDGGAARVGQQFALVADKPARRSVEDEARAADARGAHVEHLGFALGHLLHDDAGMLVIDVDGDFLDRLELLAGRAGLHDDLRACDAEFVAFAAHGFDQHGELEFAPAGDGERLGIGGALDFQRDVTFGLFLEAGPDHAARDFRAFGAGERRVVDAEGHRDGRRVDRARFERHGDRRVAEGVGDVRLGHAGEGDDVARHAFIDRHALETAEGENFRDTSLLHELAVTREDLDRLVRLDRARQDAAREDAAEERVSGNRGGEEAESAFLNARDRDMIDDHLEQFVHVGSRVFVLLRHPAILGRAVEDREIELLVSGIEVREEVETLVDDFIRAALRLVDLVDGDDRLQADLQRLGDHELGLRHGAFRGVHEHDGAVHHVEDTLDFAAEVGVAGGVHDVDAVAVPFDRGGLGQDGDAALALEIVRIHHPLGGLLVLAEGARLFEKLVHQRGLAVVNVGDDGNVAHLFDRRGHRAGFPAGGVREENGWIFRARSRGRMI